MKISYPSLAELSYFLVELWGCVIDWVLYAGVPVHFRAVPIGLVPHLDLTRPLYHLEDWAEREPFPMLGVCNAFKGQCRQYYEVSE